jgi:hypothetical protein
MKKISANDFYIKVCIWTFFCLILAGIYYQINVFIISVQTSGNTSSALQIISTINRLQKRYAAKHRGNFAPNFYELVKAENLDAKFTEENPVVNGYVFTLIVEEPTNQKPAFYSITADPLYCDCKAMHFYFDSTLSTIKYTEENRPAKAADPSI